MPKLNFNQHPNLYSQLEPLLMSQHPKLFFLLNNNELLKSLWCKMSIPFCKSNEFNQLTHHIGLISLPLTVNNKPYRAAFLHDYCCTLESNATNVMEHELLAEVMQLIEQQYDGALIFTTQCEFFIKLGFQVFPQHCYNFNWDSTKYRQSNNQTIRLLNFEDVTDVNLLKNLLSIRAPVSSVLGFREETELNLFIIIGYFQAYYCDYEKFILIFKLENNILHLYDIVSSQYRHIDVILEKLDIQYAKIITYFNPSQWDFGNQFSTLITVCKKQLMIKGCGITLDVKATLPLLAMQYI